MIYLTIAGKIPAKSNTYVLVRQKGRCAMIRDKDVKTYQDKLNKLAADAFPELVYPEGRLELTVYWHRLENDGRRRDTDNILKVLKDALNKTVFNDDSQVSSLHVYTDYIAKEEEWLDIVIQYDPNQPMRKLSSSSTIPIS
jgi:Holliday junction resolvase RusA-like endonuclease